MSLKFDHYAVMGNPIAHSKSPIIHAAFAKQTGQNIQYDALLVNDFKQSVAEFKKNGGKGLNITVPFKEQAWKLVDIRSKRAEKAGAVNTIYFDQQGNLIGDNTDGIGLVRDLTINHKAKIAEQRVLILGAGGAVRGVLEPILAANPAKCVIANRTVAKAEQLAQLFGNNIIASSYEGLKNQSFNLLINGTSASLQGKLPPLADGLLAERAWCYDMMYAKTATLFMQWAQQQGAVKVLDGLGMLVEQAAESFYLWRGVKPDTQPVIKQLDLWR
jgi:shikimate dehydrogenase